MAAAEEEEASVGVEMEDVAEARASAHTAEMINVDLLMRNLYFDEQSVGGAQRRHDEAGDDDEDDEERKERERLRNQGDPDDHQMKSFSSPKAPPEEEEEEDHDFLKAHRSTPDFPEALYELLCTLQEGRRLNDQRCSFTLEIPVRRRCHSEPNTNKPANRVLFSSMTSMTSLTREEFFELVATAQGRRLDDQRALLRRSRVQTSKPKFRSFRGSIRQLSLVRKTTPVPAPVPKEDLYDMILTTQAQGRMEEQRSRAPGLVDDEDFFSLLLKVQGGRMEEQRTELPLLLHS